MYKVILDGYVLYHPEHPDGMLTEPVLELEPGYAGVFTATVPPDNPLYDRIFCRKSMVSVFRDESLQIKSQDPNEENLQAKKRNTTAASTQAELAVGMAEGLFLG